MGLAKRTDMRWTMAPAGGETLPRQKGRMGNHMRILHTSDLHIGHVLHDQDRKEETAAMLAWLARTLKDEKVDALVVAGDVFDRSQPGNASITAYSDLYRQAHESGCRHVVVVAGNHDSPSFIDSSKPVLEGVLDNLDVTLVGGVPMADDGVRQDLSREVRVLRDEAGRPELILCAIPYLREGDVRLNEAELAEFKGKSGRPDDWEPSRAILFQEGVRRHYRQVADIALARREELAQEVGEEAAQLIPIVATGHLATAGCEIGGGEVGGDTTARPEVEAGTPEGRPDSGAGEEVEAGYIGNLQGVDASKVFPEEFQYVALGHIHKPQTVGRRDHWRYSGSPMKLDFGEGQRQGVVLVDFSQGEDGKIHRDIKVIDAPRFREMVQLKGGWEAIGEALDALKARYPGEAQGTLDEVWCEVVLTEGVPPGNLGQAAAARVEGSKVRILHCKNDVRLSSGDGGSSVWCEGEDGSGPTEMLQDLEPMDVFKRLLRSKGRVPGEGDWDELVDLFQQAVTSYADRDEAAEK